MKSWARRGRARRRLVEHQHLGTRHHHPRQHHPPRLAARHLVQVTRRQVPGAHEGQRLRRGRPHRVRHHPVAQHAVRGEEGGEHRGFTRDPAFAVPGHELLVQGRGDDAEPAAQARHIPAVVAEHAHRRRAVVVRHRPLVVREQRHQHRLAGAVRPEDGRVAALRNDEREAIEDGAPVLHHGGVGQFEQRRGHARVSHKVRRAAVRG
jgi:hypothetical protein